MSLTSNVPPIQFTLTGVVLPSETSVLSGVQADYNAAFGGGLSPALETPQGQLASSQTAIIADKNSEIALLTNQVDPQFAEGRFQDAIGRIYFLTRKTALPTVVLCDLVGLPNTIIPVGSLAQDTSGNTYRISNTVQISEAGTLFGVEFQNIVTGAIACPANTLSMIYQSISGWDTINNPADGIVGNDVESRVDFEFRRKMSVALNGKSSVDAIRAALFDVNNVLDAYVIDNTSDSVLPVGSTNYPMAPHSVYCAVVGGSDADIGLALWLKKDLGCDYNGNTSIIITDSLGYNPPYPQYDVTFERPAALPILFEINIVDSPTLPYNIVDLIKAVIIARFNGVDGDGRERIGAYVYASRYYTPVAAISTSVAILNIFIGLTTTTLTNILPGIDQVPTISASDITVNLI